MMNVPTIRATDCPRAEELAASWCIIIVQRFPSPICPIAIGYIGRLSTEEGPGRLVKLEDPFDYQSMTHVEGEGRNARAKRTRQIAPIDSLPAKAVAIAIGPGVVITRLSDIGPKAVASIREELIPAYAAREHLAKTSAAVVSIAP